MNLSILYLYYAIFLFIMPKCAPPPRSPRHLRQKHIHRVSYLIGVRQLVAKNKKFPRWVYLILILKTPYNYGTLLWVAQLIKNNPRFTSRKFVWCEILTHIPILSRTTIYAKFSRIYTSNCAIAVVISGEYSYVHKHIIYTYCCGQFEFSSIKFNCPCERWSSVCAWYLDAHAHSIGPWAVRCDEGRQRLRHSQSFHTYTYTSMESDDRATAVGDVQSRRRVITLIK